MRTENVEEFGYPENCWNSTECIYERFWSKSTCNILTKCTNKNGGDINLTSTLTVGVIMGESTTEARLVAKLEFDDYESQEENQWFDCALVVYSLVEDLSLYGLHIVDIHFYVSRTNYTVNTRSGIYSDTKIRPHFVYSKLVDGIGVFDYRYEERIVDGASEITAAVTSQQVDSSFVTSGVKFLTIVQTSAWPTVIHHASYIAYSYTDWVADVGGFFTIVGTIFFAFSIQVTKYANRNDPFNRRQGILPILSRTYRNAEELAGVRVLMLSALGISDEEYFTDGAPANI